LISIDLVTNLEARTGQAEAVCKIEVFIEFAIERSGLISVDVFSGAILRALRRDILDRA
jgi:hypothetical protein